MTAKLAERGVGKPGEVIANATEHGCGPQHVAEIIAHFDANAGAWGAGALRNRVRDAFPKVAPDANWPPPSKDFERSKRRRKEQDRAEAERALVEKWRPTMDAMTPDERIAAARELGGFAMKAEAKRVAKSPLKLATILEAAEARGPP